MITRTVQNVRVPRTFRAAAADPAIPLRLRQALPREGPFDRHQALLDSAHGHSVIHLGFVDERLEQKAAEGVWLHARLAEVARSLVGLDSSAAGVAWAREHGYQAKLVDLQSQDSVAALEIEPAEVVIAGELIEHLGAPGPFLRGLPPLLLESGQLVLTTPNASRLLSFLTPLAAIEWTHPDHVAWHSPRTLRTLLEQNGWQIERMAYYSNPVRHIPPDSNPLRGHVANLVRRGLASGLRGPFRYWSEGLIAWARPEVFR